MQSSSEQPLVRETREGMINSTFYSRILDLSYTPKGRLTLNLSTLQGDERFLRI